MLIAFSYHTQSLTIYIPSLTIPHPLRNHCPNNILSINTSYMYLKYAPSLFTPILSFRTHILSLTIPHPLLIPIHYYTPAPFELNHILNLIPSLTTLHPYLHLDSIYNSYLITSHLRPNYSTPDTYI